MISYWLTHLSVVGLFLSDSLWLNNPTLTVGLLSRLFGKTREGYYASGKAKRSRSSFKKRTIRPGREGHPRRSPRIGSKKMLYMLRASVRTRWSVATSSTSSYTNTTLS